MADDREPWLSRWSRLKGEARAVGAADDRRRGGALPTAAGEEAQGPPAPVPSAPPTSAPSPARQEIAVDDLPPIESLGQDSDYTVFLKEGVPEALSRAALQKLWRSDPMFAHQDGLDLYDKDYSLAATELVSPDEMRRMSERPAPAGEEPVQAADDGATDGELADDAVRIEGKDAASDASVPHDTAEENGTPIEGTPHPGGGGKA